MKILAVVGARPNFMKIAPILKELQKSKIPFVLAHTGQHYDRKMSDFFFNQLKIPKPDYNLNVGSGSYAMQVGTVMLRLEEIILKEKPSLVLVVGDVNSTVAAALLAKQHHIPVAHIEAGLRSFDMGMPEEINRMVTDRISDFLFTTEGSANKNLMQEGIPLSKIFFVGNIMIETLLMNKKIASQSTILDSLSLEKKNYCVMTMHRPSNVDAKGGLLNMLAIIEPMQKLCKIVLPLHPRTKKSIKRYGLEKEIKSMGNLIITEPLSYLDFLNLMMNATLVLTDSGGIQEETTALRIPCITIRETTERPITLTKGTNYLVSTNKKKVITTALSILNGSLKKKSSMPHRWDKNVSKRIVAILQKRSI